MAGPHDATRSRQAARAVRRGPPATRLVVVYPPAIAGATFGLTGEPLVLGRAPGEGGRALPDSTVSRGHLALEARAGAFVVRDLGSRNGSALNGVGLDGTPRPLADGDVLRAGDALLVFEQGRAVGEPDAPEVAPAAVPGQAAVMRRVRAAVARAAADRAPALVVGETGVGKERIAAELHRLSARRGPLVAVNCAALAAELIESQLFGHVRGAFTGADDAQPGLFRAADGGTLFLDEIGELPLELQPKLLRALQDGEVRPVGGTRASRIDVRIIGASNRDLPAAVAAGGFRRDLYARLALWEIPVPPLRARRADILFWIERLHLDWLAGRAEPPRPLRLGADAAEALTLCGWPDNLRGVARLVRELGAGRLEHPVERADLPGWLTAPPGAAGTPEVTAAPARRLPAPTRDELLAFLESNAGSVRAAARHFGRDRRQIYRWLDSHGLRDRARGEDAD